MFEAALVARLAPISTNVYPLQAPEGCSFPVVVYVRRGTAPLNDLSNGQSATPQWALIDLQVSVYDPDYTTALQLADEIRTNLQAWDDDDVQSCVWTEQDSWIDDTTETNLYHVLSLFSVFARV